jgi:hypothetical protein
VTDVIAVCSLSLSTFSFLFVWKWFDVCLMYFYFHSLFITFYSMKQITCSWQQDSSSFLLHCLSFIKIEIFTSNIFLLNNPQFFPHQTLLITNIYWLKLMKSLVFSKFELNFGEECFLTQTHPSFHFHFILLSECFSTQFLLSSTLRLQKS